jgi:hypothetical protein
MKWLFALVLLMARPYTPSQQSVSPDLFVEAYISLAEPYAGQQIEFQVRFFDSVGAANPLYEAPSFEGFWRVEPDRISRTVEVRGNQQYSLSSALKRRHYWYVRVRFLKAHQRVFPVRLVRSHCKLLWIVNR